MTRWISRVTTYGTVADMLSGRSVSHVDQWVRDQIAKAADAEAAWEFDATLEESQAWARAQTDPETIRIMAAKGIGPDRSKDQ